MIQKNQPATFSIALRIPDGSAFLDNATIVAGDFQISLDGGAFVNLSVLPTVVGPFVFFSLVSAETNANLVSILGRDQTATAEWQEVAISFNPSTLLQETVRIPRSATALVAGGSYTKTGTAFATPAAGTETFDEVIA